MEGLEGLVGDEDLEGDLDDLVGDLEGEFGDGDVREAENEFRDEGISGLFFSLFSLSLSFLKKWASWTIGGGEGGFFFFLLSKAVESGRFPWCVNHRWEGLGEYQLPDFWQLHNFDNLVNLF